MKIRFIGTSPKDGSLNTETITFTQDFKSSAADWCRSGHEVYCDQIIEMDLPTSFPLENTFER